MVARRSCVTAVVVVRPFEVRLTIGVADSESRSRARSPLDPPSSISITSSDTSAGEAAGIEVGAGAAGAEVGTRRLRLDGEGTEVRAAQHKGRRRGETSPQA